MKHAARRKYHYIYKITRTFDNRFYIDMHSTENIDDEYFGSGKLITRSIKKHGVNKHTKEILEYLECRETLKKREKELITADLRLDPMCMNIAPGGGGGFISHEYQQRCSSAGGRAPKDYKAIAVKALITKKKRGTNFIPDPRNFLGKTHSEETRIKIGIKTSLAQAGEKNSSYGTCWVIKADIKPFKIKKEQLDEYISNGYSRGRILKEGQ